MANGRQPETAEEGAAKDAAIGVTGQELKPSSAKNGAEALWNGSGTVLLADDEESVRMTGKRMLERMGFTVLTATDGSDAIRVFRQNPETIVCVLLDIEMPCLDGSEVFHELRKIRKDVRVILSSGGGKDEVVRKLEEDGLSGYIEKPYRFVDLRSKMQQIVEEG